MATPTHSLGYAGCNFLRQRLVLATLSGRPVKIRKIRARDDNPGLRVPPALAVNLSKEKNSFLARAVVNGRT